MVSIDPTLPFTNDDEFEDESPAYLNESSDEQTSQSEYVYSTPHEVSYETDYNSIFWGLLSKEQKESVMSSNADEGAAAAFDDVDAAKHANETLTETNTKIDAMNTELKTDVPEVEKLINAGLLDFQY